MQPIKKVLILAIGCQLKPWDSMIQTSLDTWDSLEVKGVDTIFYCGNPVKENTDKIVYFPIDESYYTMGKKLLLAFEWCLQNKSFDYIARVNSSCYVDKSRLLEHVQTLEEKNIFNGIEVEDSPKWLWGGGQYILSKDVVEKIVNNKRHWNHDVMEDQGLSRIVAKLGIPFGKGKSCTIDKINDYWRCLCYGSESFEFSDFKDLSKANQFFFRVKQDYDRNVDTYLMKEIFKNLPHD
jgi:hypothetical protein